MTTTDHFLMEKAWPPTTATPPSSIATTRALSYFRMKIQPTVQKEEPSGVFHRESITAEDSTKQTDLEQIDHLSPFCDFSSHSLHSSEGEIEHRD